MKSLQISKIVNELLNICNSSSIKTDKVLIPYIGLNKNDIDEDQSPSNSYIVAYSYVVGLLQFFQDNDSFKIKEISFVYTDNEKETY